LVDSNDAGSTSTAKLGGEEIVEYLKAVIMKVSMDGT